MSDKFKSQILFLKIKETIFNHLNILVDYMYDNNYYKDYYKYKNDGYFYTFTYDKTIIDIWRGNECWKELNNISKDELDLIFKYITPYIKNYYSVYINIVEESYKHYPNNKELRIKYIKTNLCLKLFSDILIEYIDSHYNCDKIIDDLNDAENILIDFYKLENK